MSQPSRFEAFTDHQWARIEPLLPSNEGHRGRPFTRTRQIVNGIVFRYRTGIPWWDLPRDRFGPWQTVWQRHRRYAEQGTWDEVLTHILAAADASGLIEPNVSIDATIVRAHQHATNTRRPEVTTGGRIE
ncbi:MAG: IS5 family transposase [Propionibacterium freudenreichii]